LPGFFYITNHPVRVVEFNFGNNLREIEPM
jgi:hypothetical protein